MKELLIATGPARVGVPRSFFPSLRIEGWETKAATWDAFEALHHLPDVTVVSAAAGSSGDLVQNMVANLAAKQVVTRDGSMIVLHLETSVRPDAGFMKTLLRCFRHPERVEFRWSRDALNQNAIEEYVAEVSPKLEFFNELEEAAYPPSGPLDQLRSTIKATAGLRTDNGRVSAQAVADLYKVPVSRLADWLGRNRQTVFKTPDAESLQGPLEYFERVARLLTVFSVEDFRKWLRQPNPLLDDIRPLDLMGEGKWQLVADFVADMLTGNPS